VSHQLTVAKSYKHSAKMIFAIQEHFQVTDKIADFLRNKDCFLIPKRDLHYFWSSAQHCAVFLATVAARQNRVFSLRIGHIVHSF